MIGELFRMMELELLMLELYADNLDIPHTVRPSITQSDIHLSCVVICCLNLWRVCNYLFSDVGNNCCARFGPGTGPIHMNSLACFGSEYRIGNCPYNPNTEGELHNEDWSVYCNIG